MEKVLAFIFAIFFALLSNSQDLSSKSEYKDYFRKNISNLDPIEGIWSVSVTVSEYI
jgi:hypothetical protein